MSYVFGGTLALAGISEQQAQEYGPPGHSPLHATLCYVCRQVIEARHADWLRRASALQVLDVERLFNTPMSIAHSRLVMARAHELRFA